MLSHFWKSAWRNLLRYKRLTAINIAGLSLSIAIFIALNGYIRYHLSYDQFYPQGDQIFRVDYFEYQDGAAVLESARTHDRTALLLHEYLPDAEAVTRVYNEKAYVFTEDVKIVDQNMLYADSSFFNVFEVKMIAGDPNTALIPPMAVVISQTAAHQYFGDADPMGKTLYFNERLPFIVTGVFEDLPGTSSIDYDFLLSWSTMTFYGWVTRDGTFDFPWTFTYVKLRENHPRLSSLNSKLTKMAADHITNLAERRRTAKFSLSAYQNLHFALPLTGEVKPGMNKTLLYALVSLSIFVLVAAWMNYINLSLAQSLTRASEIGVRKVFGASGLAISGQFILEALILSTLTFVAGAILYYVFTGPYSDWLFAQVTFARMTAGTWILYFAAFVAGTTLAAFYPSYIMSRFKPVLILRNKLGTGRGKSGQLQKGLMVFQLFLAIAVIGVTFVAQRQISFMRNFDSGFNIRQTISLRGPASTNSDSLRYVRYTSFRNEVLRLPAFKDGGASMNIPGQEIRFHDDGVYAVGSKSDQKQSLSVMWIDNGYQETFGMSLLSGRNFELREPKTSCIINQSAALALGFSKAEDAINTSLIGGDNVKYTIVGVWKDYHHESIHKAVSPIMFIFRHPHEYGYYSFRMETTSTDFLPALQKIWNEHYPADTFTCYFMDSFFEEQYTADLLFEKLLTIFGVASVVIACLGLYGMASLAMVKRTKEIGVRKVLGASVPRIMLLLSQTYIRLVIIGSAIAFPLVWYITARWLEGFSYRVDVRWWMIVLPSIFVLLISLATISVQTIRAAMSNPAQVLRDQ